MPPRRRSRGAGGCPFVSIEDDLTHPLIWRPELSAVTVILDGAPEGFGAAAVDPATLGALIADRAGPDGRHVIVADVAGDHWLWLRAPEPDRPLAAVIPLDKDFATRMASLTRFHRRLFSKDAGPPPRSWPLSEQRIARLQLMLRAFDLRQTGTTYREIARAVGRERDAELSASEWKMSSGRSFVIRLVRDATAMMNGDYRKLLRIR
jgi:hypothetical protein